MSSYLQMYRFNSVSLREVYFKEISFRMFFFFFFFFSKYYDSGLFCFHNAYLLVRSIAKEREYALKS